MKMIDRLEDKLLQLGSPRTTRRTYRTWVNRYFRFIVQEYGREIRPEACGKAEIEAWLTAMAKDDYSPRTQAVALQAVLFLYHQILEIRVEGVDALRPRKSTRVPSVLNMTEVERLLAAMKGIPLLTSKIQVGCGLRIGEVCSLRIKDLDFKREQIFVRAAKGAKDRITCFPKAMHADVQRQVDSSNLNRSVTAAASRAGIAKRVTTHTLRHTFATYMLSYGTDIQTLASLMGHSDIRTTQVYLHCNTNSGTALRSPFAELLANPPRTTERKALRVYAG